MAKFFETFMLFFLLVDSFCYLASNIAFTSHEFFLSLCDIYLELTVFLYSGILSCLSMFDKYF